MVRSDDDDISALSRLSDLTVQNADGYGIVLFGQYDTLEALSRESIGWLSSRPQNHDATTRMLLSKSLTATVAMPELISDMA
jgi:hypothetical protein